DVCSGGAVWWSGERVEVVRGGNTKLVGHALQRCRWLHRLARWKQTWAEWSAVSNRSVCSARRFGHATSLLRAKARESCAGLLQGRPCHARVRIRHLVPFWAV